MFGGWNYCKCYSKISMWQQLNPESPVGLRSRCLEKHAQIHSFTEHTYKLISQGTIGFVMIVCLTDFLAVWQCCRSQVMDESDMKHSFHARFIETRERFSSVSGLHLSDGNNSAKHKSSSSVAGSRNDKLRSISTS